MKKDDLTLTIKKLRDEKDACARASENAIKKTQDAEQLNFVAFYDQAI